MNSNNIFLILTTLTRDIKCEKFIEDVSVSNQIQCFQMITSQINQWF